ncbi:ABC transporter ATP-binding protein [Anaerococcus sp. AGMB00486]|uniref:ABC transporter ATP-binding protein n=2 Tax=Anaerococcus TaxID=165779 RepID=A0ABX2NA58_9FIRM|nr:MULTISPECIES: ABC transporter ATP-binding protein [Anaerococcus]MDY3006721.1 ABC transporter ATP-binding protein [Anaerococcus porci]MSS77712.1 ABC transporter ATP-binding protein [Anaerococcus porci]NVF11568.1 ABC transporter ATP-binding protein [Anaerococcus faecalis]
MNTYKKLFAYVPEIKNKAIFAVIFTAISNLTLFFAYYKIWTIIKVIFTKNSSDGLIKYSNLIVILFIAYGLIYFLGLWQSHLLAFRLETRLREKGAKKLLRASESFFDTHSSGEVRKIIDNNVEGTHMAVAHLIPDQTAAIITPILMLILVFKIDLFLGLFFVGVVLASFFIMKAMMGDKTFMEIYMKKLDKLNAGAVEYVRFIPVVKIFNAPLKGIKSLYESIIDYRDIVYEYSMSCRIPFVTFQWLLNIFIVSPIFLAIFMVKNGSDPYLWSAKILFFTLFTGMFFANMMKIMYVSTYHFQANSAVDNLERLFEEMQSKKVIFGEAKKIDKADIVFEKVDFSYDDEKNILEDFSVKFQEGKSYALVGSSGSGKSTIARLISGSYPLDKGKILLDGRDIKSYDKDFLMDNIGMVFQNPKLFKGISIYDNVALAKENSEKKEVIEALKKARCFEFIDKFEKGVDTVIGDAGVNLSGGEIQRISIARIFLKNPRILILDEASAAADPENEHELQIAFKELMKNRTTIMIAHRLSSIRGVDEIFLIDDGKIKEKGNHKDLMAKDGSYKYFVDLYDKANEWRI